MGRRVIAGSVVLTASLVAVGCSANHSQPTTPSTTKTALTQMGAIPPAKGFVRGSDPCTDGYVCFHSASSAAMTVADYRRLSSEFGVNLTTTQCDPLLTFNGRATQTCSAYGRYGRWGVIAVLTVRRTDASNAGTDVDFAPVRDYG